MSEAELMSKYTNILNLMGSVTDPATMRFLDRRAKYYEGLLGLGAD